MTIAFEPWRQLHQQTGVTPSSLAEGQSAAAAEPLDAEWHR